MSHSVSDRAEGTVPATLQEQPQAARDGWSSFWRPSFWRFVPFVLLLGGGVAFYIVGLQQHVSLTALVRHREALGAFVDASPVLSGAIFFLIYVGVVVFSVPAASVLTVFSGFLFGSLMGGALVIVAATLGASLLFLAARGMLAGLLRPRAGNLLERFAEGFRRNAFLYLLMLRLAPVFPFFIVNIAPAFFDIRLRTFTVATLIGIVPGTFAYAWLGSGLDDAVAVASATGRDLSLEDFATRDVSFALVALALIAALPLGFKLVQSRRKTM